MENGERTQNRMNQPKLQTTNRWARVIVACGAFALVLTGYAMFDLFRLLRASADGDANGMLRFFLCVMAPPFFASFRVLLRRRWAAIVVALFGWFAVYDVLSAPSIVNRLDWLSGLMMVATLVLTLALFNGEKAWKRGF